MEEEQFGSKRKHNKTRTKRNDWLTEVLGQHFYLLVIHDSNIFRRSLVLTIATHNMKPWQTHCFKQFFKWYSIDRMLSIFGFQKTALVCSEHHNTSNHIFCTSTVGPMGKNPQGTERTKGLFQSRCSTTANQTICFYVSLRELAFSKDSRTDWNQNWKLSILL